jgi:DNA-binding Lrp family transcriptional regulator
MTTDLNDFQKQLLKILQEPLLVCREPFVRIAQHVNSDRNTILDSIKQFKDSGLIRRFGPQINYRALGKTACLVTAHVPDEDISITSAVVNAIPGVSHNYLRDHHYNMWFTLQADTQQQIDNLLQNLSKRLGTQFYSLKAKKVFKLDVRFDPDLSEPFKRSKVTQQSAIPSQKGPVKLDDIQKKILNKLQTNFEIVPCPFDYLSFEDNIDIELVLQKIQLLIDTGVIRKISAVLDHRKLGYNANVMFCAKVKPQNIEHAGSALASYKMVSHCYHRDTFQDFPYNLFAMMHAADSEQIEKVIAEFTANHSITDFAALATTAELKKSPVIHQL